jgi:hypothetical protein
MTDFELWEHINKLGQMANSWWYSVAVLPATIIAGCTYLLMWFALRRVEKLPVMFLWLVLASVPLIMVLPSYYVSLSLHDALARVGFQAPATIQQLSLTTTRQIGGYLSQIATFGIIGVSLAVVIIFASMLIGGYAPPVVQAVQALSQNFTKAMTRAFGSRRGGQSVVSSRYGVIKVTRGQQQGTQFGVINGALIGKTDATMIITDEIVSRRHARFEIRTDRAYIVDENSTNGTYLFRHGAMQEIGSQAIALQPGDKIYLGQPNEPDSVELTFDKPSPGGI